MVLTLDSRAQDNIHCVSESLYQYRRIHLRMPVYVVVVPVLAESRYKFTPDNSHEAKNIL